MYVLCNFGNTQIHDNTRTSSRTKRRFDDEDKMIFHVDSKHQIRSI